MDDLTYTDALWHDAGVIGTYELSMEHGPSSKNSFSLACPISTRPMIEARSLIYVEGTEFGGIVDEMGIKAKRSGRKRSIYQGRTWHGLLAGKIVCPDAGQTHYHIRGEANTALLALIHRVGLGDLFTASSANSGIILDHQVRFVDGYTAALDALRASGAKLKIAWDGGRAVLSAEPIKDWSAAEELDTDHMSFDMSKCYRPVNHLVCVGEGELTDRVEVHFYADADGNVSQTQTLFGVDERAAKYDYSNADTEQLTDEGRKKLEDMQNEDTCDADVTEGYSYDVGDLVGAYDVDANIFVSAPVVAKIAVVDRHGARTSYKIGEATRSSSLSGSAESSGGGGRTYIAGANITISGSTISADVGISDIASVESVAREACTNASNASAAAGRAQETANGKAALEHTHDGRYYTEVETDSKLAGKAATSHTHTKAQIIDFPAALPASDVYGWAKAPSKPSYTAADVGAAGSGHGHASATEKVAGFLATADKAKLNGIASGANAYVLPTAGTALGGVRTTSSVTSASGYTPVPIISGVPYFRDTNTVYTHPATHPATMITQDSTHRFATDAEKQAWNAKAPSTAATTKKAGLVKPDGVTVKVSSDGTLSAEQGGAASFLAAHPPHSLYWTESPTSPQEQYGGVWERRKWPHGYLWARKS